MILYVIIICPYCENGSHVFCCGNAILVGENPHASLGAASSPWNDVKTWLFSMIHCNLLPILFLLQNIRFSDQSCFIVWHILRAHYLESRAQTDFSGKRDSLIVMYILLWNISHMVIHISKIHISAIWNRFQNSSSALKNIFFRFE